MAQLFGHEKLKATAEASAESSQVEDRREMLRCIAAMLTSLSKLASHDT